MRLFPLIDGGITVGYKYRSTKFIHHKVWFELVGSGGDVRHLFQESQEFQSLKERPVWYELVAWLDKHCGCRWYTSSHVSPCQHCFYFETQEQAFLFKLVWG